MSRNRDCLKEPQATRGLSLKVGGSRVRGQSTRSGTRLGLSRGAVNRKVNVITRKSYGYRSPDVLKAALFHALGGLPEPERTHRF